MRKIIPFFLAFSLVFTGAAHAAAPAVDATGAATLKKLLDDDLQWRADMTQIVGQGVAVDGKTQVTPKNGFYEISLPHIYFILANQEGKLDAGHITLNVAPAEAGAWLIQQVTLPPAMTLYDAKGTAVDTVTVGKQRLIATWNPDQGVYSKVDSLLQNVKIASLDKNAPSVTVGALKALVNFKENGDGTWNGPADFGAADIAINMPGQNPVSISAGKVLFRNVYDRLDMRPTLKSKEEARQLLLKNGIPKTDQEKRAFLARFLTTNPVDAQGISSSISIENFVMHDNGAPQQAQRLISFDQLTASGLTPDMKSAKNKLLVKAGFQGLRVSFVPQALAALVPHVLNVEITLDNIPVSEMIGQFFNIAKKQANTVATGPDAQKKAQDATKAMYNDAVAQLPKILEDAGASVSLYNTYAKSDAISASLESKIDADPKAVLGVVGKVTMSIKGLDEFTQNMQNAALKTGADPHMLGYLMGIMTLQTKGMPGKAADGVSLRNFAVDLKKNGDVLLNGVVVNPKPAAPADEQKP